MDPPKRKSTRLNGYDYSQNGAYFVTICVSNPKVSLWRIGDSIWQKSFNDRIIRGEKEYRTIWQYIDENPFKMDGEDKADGRYPSGEYFTGG